MTNWSDEYDDACRELTLAKEQHRIADSALANANARLRTAEDRVGRLFLARMNAIAAHT